MRIGRWKDRVSSVQRARKKRYWRIIGCAARKDELNCVGGGEEVVVLVKGSKVGEVWASDWGVSWALLVADWGFEVAFSMRAQVR